jgi:two-component system, chemotaxis family, chemotaxis protein CheY
MKLLVVEDDPICCKVLKGMLEPYAECEEAKNGKEAVSAFIRAIKSGSPYDLILLDIMMPEMDGQEAVREIRRIEEEEWGFVYPKGVKIIMTTCLDDPQNVVNAFRSLCDAYLVKPIDEELLFSEIRTYFPTFAKKPPPTE